MKKGERKQFCPKKHDTNIVGRDNSGHCKQCVKDYHARILDSTLDRRRKNRLKFYYDMSPEDYQKLLNEQSGLCAGCLVPKNQVDRIFSVDHDHKTGKIRGLLCHSCNLVLGHVKDTASILRRLADYLEMKGKGN